MNVTRYLARLATRESLDALSVQGRTRIGLLEGWVSVVVNLLLALVKGALGVWSGSVALVADAFHTLSDCLTSGAIILGFWMASKPPDAEHPFGHGRIESVASLVVSVMLGVTAVELGRAAVVRMFSPQPTHGGVWLMVAVVVTAVVKLWLSFFSRKLGLIIDSSALKADAMHHLTDVFATLLVVAALSGETVGLPWLDGAVGLLVALLVAWAAVEAMRAAVGPLIGEFAPDEVYGRIRSVATRVPGVADVHDIVVHRYGQTWVMSLHIEVSDRLSSSRVHQIAEQVEEAVRRHVGGYVTVHADPIDQSHPMYERAQRLIGTVLRDCHGCGRAHDLRLHDGANQTLLVEFDVGTTPELDDQQRAVVEQRLSKKLKELSPGDVAVTLRFLPPYSRDG